MQISETVELNGLCYCQLHLREICHACTLDMQWTNEITAFHLPEDGPPEYPQVRLSNRRDFEAMDLLAARWLDMQRALYPKPKPESMDISAHMIVLPPVDGSDYVKASPSPMAMHETLLRLFHQLQGMASTQHYDFATWSQILLQDYETFSEASGLYEEELSDTHSRSLYLMALRGQDLTSSLGRLRIKMANRQKAKASLISTFSFFLELKTHRSFWQTMELTAEAFVRHVESFNQEADGNVVLTDMAKVTLLEWIGHVFWSLQHAQFRLNVLRNIQHEVYNRDTYPFYPYVREALEAGLDVHLIIIKLSKAELHDFGSVPPLLKELQEASKYSDQMGFINAGMMAAIDEFSSRFRVLQVLYYVAQLVASEDEIKVALMTYPFDPEGADMHSKMDDVLCLLTNVHEGCNRPPPPRNPSFLQKLIIKENAFRQQYSVKMSSVCPISNNFNVFTKDMFNAFKSNFLLLYRDHIRPQWKEYECSLLSLNVMKRTQHRREVEKEKRRQRNKRPVSGLHGECAQVAEARAVVGNSYMDASLFWEVGDGSLEPYVPPTIRKKIKTHKEGTTDAEITEVAVSDKASQPSDVPLLPRSLDQLKKSDLVTRDVLWGKMKGSLKWSCLLQLLTRIGCKILNLDGSKRKVVDMHSGNSIVLHMPHPGDTCRTDQRKLYCDHVKEHLKIRYEDLVRPGAQEEDLQKSLQETGEK